MAVLRGGPPKSGFQTAIWVAKLAFLLAGLMSIAALARIAVPYAAALLASAVPRAWTALRIWLVPPYLFITVHLIIMVIWKLSDHRHHHHTHSWPADDLLPDSPQPLKPKDLGDAPPVLVSHLRKPSREIWREISPDTLESDAATPALAKEPADPSPPSDASCLTTELDEKSTASSHLDIKKNVALAPETVEPVEEEEEEAPAPVLEIEENDSMDETWKAIMERSRSSRSEAAAGRGIRLPEAIRAAPPAAADPDEMNRRFEDFIKKKKDEIRLQRHESDQPAARDG